MSQGGKRLSVIDSNSRFDILAKTNIFIVKGSRLCRCHLDEKGFVIEKDLNLVQSIDGEVTFDEISIKNSLQCLNNLKQVVKYLVNMILQVRFKMTPYK